MIFKITGIVAEVLHTQEFSGGFTKRTLVLDNDIGSDAKYPANIPFTFKKERTALLDSIRKGQRVTVTFAIDGRKWDGPKGTQYFADLTGIRVEAAEGSVPAPATPKQEEMMSIDEALNDDTPF